MSHQRRGNVSTRLLRFMLSPGHPLRPGEGWRQMVRDGAVLEGGGQLMREPRITPELFKVKGTELPPPQSAALLQLRGAHSPAGTGSFGKKTYF